MKHGFQFHAFATGVAGHISHPFDHLIETLAPAALAPQGGYSSGRTNNYRLRELMSFRSTYTQVSGGWSEETQSWDTVMTATVEGLEMLGALKADLIVARLASRHRKGGGEPSIIPLGSRIEGLQIGGANVNVELHSDLYSKLDTYSGVLNSYREDAEFRSAFNQAQYVGKASDVPEEHRHHFPWCGYKPGKDIPNSGGPLATSLVKGLRSSSEALSSYGHVILVPQFGAVSIGSFVIYGQARRLTMLRVDLGCAACGTVTAASGETNGQPMPPPVSRGN